MYIEREEAENIVKMNILGNVEGKNILIIDDIAETCGTLLEASRILEKSGAKQIVAGIVHAFAPKIMLDKLKNSKISTLILTNSIPYCEIEENPMIKLIRIDISEYLSNWIHCIHYESHIPRILYGGE